MRPIALNDVRDCLRAFGEVGRLDRLEQLENALQRTARCLVEQPEHVGTDVQVLGHHLDFRDLGRAFARTRLRAARRRHNQTRNNYVKKNSASFAHLELPLGKEAPLLPPRRTIVHPLSDASGLLRRDKLQVLGDWGVLYVKPEVHDVAFLDDVVLAFEP